MTIRKIIRMGHPNLRKIASTMSRDEILSEETKVLIQDMIETMKDADGIGLAAPQVNVLKQLAIIGFEEENPRYPDADPIKLLVVINPQIEPLDEETQGCWEGCLSVPGLRGFVERPAKIKVKFLDENANEQVLMLEGFSATVFQHETDHLFGKLYIDRITDTTKISFIEEFDEFMAKQEVDPE